MTKPAEFSDELLKLKRILGDRGAGAAPIIPVSRSTWWEGVRTGRYPAPVRLGPRSRAWRGSDIRRIPERGVA